MLANFLSQLESNEPGTEVPNHFHNSSLMVLIVVPTENPDPDQLLANIEHLLAHGQAWSNMI